MSPYCPGRLISNCPSPGAEQLRIEIRTRLGAGETREAIVEDLYQRFGESIRATPRATGIGILAWVMPGLAVLGGGVVLGWLLRRRVTASQAVQAAPPEIDPQAEGRIAKELEKLRI